MAGVASLFADPRTGAMQRGEGERAQELGAALNEQLKQTDERGLENLTEGLERAIQGGATDKTMDALHSASKSGDAEATLQALADVLAEMGQTAAYGSAPSDEEQMSARSRGLEDVRQDLLSAMRPSSEPTGQRGEEEQESGQEGTPDETAPGENARSDEPPSSASDGEPGENPEMEAVDGGGPDGDEKEKSSTSEDSEADFRQSVLADESAPQSGGGGGGMPEQLDQGAAAGEATVTVSAEGAGQGQPGAGHASGASTPGADEARDAEVAAAATWVESQWSMGAEGVLRAVSSGASGERSNVNYREVHRQYAAIAESEAREESLPSTRRAYIREYFDVIRGPERR